MVQNGNFRPILRCSVLWLHNIIIIQITDKLYDTSICSPLAFFLAGATLGFLVLLTVEAAAMIIITIEREQREIRVSILAIIIV